MELISEPINQQEWHKQVLTHYNRPNIKYVRRTDTMSIKQILDLYREGLIPCDTCEQNMPIKPAIDLAQHIAHAINPMVLWSCDRCIQEDFRKVRIIAGFPKPFETSLNTK